MAPSTGNGNTARSIVGLLAVLLVLATANPALADVVVVDKQKARGNYPTVQASGDVLSPTKLWVTVKARPSQPAMVFWWMTCSRGGDTKSSSARFREMAPVTHAMKMPYRTPDECQVAITASLDDRGTIVVMLTARV